jgi:hypothetical protein
MSYRDDRDALRGRVDDLEGELAKAREEAARGSDEDRPRRIAELEARMAEQRRLIDGMGAELDALRERPARADKPGGARLALVAGLGAVAVASVGVVVILQLRPRSRSAPVVTTVEPVLPQPPATPPAEDPPAVTPPPVATAVAPTFRKTTARWVGRVKRATGRALAAGAPCIVEGSLEGSDAKIGVERLTVACGGATLYDSSATLNGMSMSGAGVEENAGERAGTFRYAIQYQDKGTRTGLRTEASIDSLAGVGAAWSDTMPSFRVELALPYESDAVAGDGLLAAARQVLRRGAVVTGTEGAAPLRAGARCDLRVTPRPSGKECLARLTCGREVLYGKGTTGVAGCTLSDGRVERLTDTEPTGKGGDPELDVDTASGSMKLADEIGSARWSVSFKLDASP